MQMTFTSIISLHLLFMELILLSLKVLLMFSTQSIIVIISIIGPVMLVLSWTVQSIVFFGCLVEDLVLTPQGLSFAVCCLALLLLLLRQLVYLQQVSHLED
jgi:hypothetical protein